MNRLLIVGNGRMKGKYGEIIDSKFDCVIRMNGFEIIRYYEIVGTRVDIVALLPFRLFDTAFMTREIWWAVTRAHFQKVNQGNRILKILPDKKHVFLSDFPAVRKVWFPLRRKLYSEQPGVSFTTGFTVIIMALNLYPDWEIYLTGFDWGQSGHYFNSEHAHFTHHAWEWESKWIAGHLESGRLKLLEQEFTAPLL